MMLAGRQLTRLMKKIICRPSSSSSSSSLCLHFSRIVDTSSVSSWTSAIADLSRSGHHHEALLAFLSLRRRCHSLSPSSLLPALSSAASLPSLPFGRQLHLLSLRLGFLPSDPFLSSALLSLYSAARLPSQALAVFLQSRYLNSVLYTALSSCFLRNSRPLHALALFPRLLSRLGPAQVDPPALVSALSACARSASPAARALHALVVKLGMVAHTSVGNTLLNAYAKNGEVDSGRKLFEEMPERDEVTWNSLVAAYAKGGRPGEAVEAYREMMMMLRDGEARSNVFALSAVLAACADARFVQVGRCLHDQAIRMGLEENVYVGTSVVDMYCKCGRVDAARKAFRRTKERNIKTWSAMVAGYGMHGRGREALDVFEQMIEVGVRPNYVTFVSVLDACSHSGLLEDGRRWFDAMKRDYDIDPGVEHYGCMVDLLARAGRLEEAYGLIKEMRVEPDSMIWGSLLAACRVHKNVELGEISASKALQLDPKNCGFYVSLSNIYAGVGRWKDVERMRVLIKTRGVVKPPGYSLVELHGKSHMFMVGDRRHPRHEEIYGYLEKLRVRMQEIGYVPDTGSVLHDVEQEEKESILGVHSEKLAVAFAIMSTDPGSQVLVIKNLRVCGDCHTAIKMMAKLECREIVVRDSHRFHHFRDGICSCRDYW